jgi:hypothetical protein
MKVRSPYITALLNILLIVFTMNATLAHSTCAISSTELSQQADQDLHSGMSMATESPAMPCHETDSSEPTNPDSTSLNQCCSDCSVFSLPMDATKAIPTAHPDIASTALTSTTSRNIELPFRPPIISLL